MLCLRHHWGTVCWTLPPGHPVPQPGYVVLVALLCSSLKSFLTVAARAGSSCCHGNCSWAWAEEQGWGNGDRAAESGIFWALKVNTCGCKNVSTHSRPGVSTMVAASHPRG